MGIMGGMDKLCLSVLLAATGDAGNVCPPPAGAEGVDGTDVRAGNNKGRVGTAHRKKQYGQDILVGSAHPTSLFFLIALAGLASVKWFLGVNFSPSMIISTSLFVGLVGGFTRHAHQFLSYIPKR